MQIFIITAVYLTLQHSRLSGIYFKWLQRYMHFRLENYTFSFIFP